MNISQNLYMREYFADILIFYSTSIYAEPVEVDKYFITKTSSRNQATPQIGSQ